MLVTGAGGSVGSELVRQVTRLQPTALMLLDHNENALFFTDSAVRATSPLIDVSARIVDLTVPTDVARVFAEFRPQVVLHAAAHKHVGLMEDVPGEAILARRWFPPPVVWFRVPPTPVPDSRRGCIERMGLGSRPPRARYCWWSWCTGRCAGDGAPRVASVASESI